jgi:hypothetical protein
LQRSSLHFETSILLSAAIDLKQGLDPRTHAIVTQPQWWGCLLLGFVVVEADVFPDFIVDI